MRVAGAHRRVVGLVIAAFAVSATAGIGVWTTTGPRAAWDIIGGDSCVGGGTIVGAFGRMASTPNVGSHWVPQETPQFEQRGWSDRSPGDFFTPIAIAGDRWSGALYFATSTGWIYKSTAYGAFSRRQGAQLPLDPVGDPSNPDGYEAHVSRLTAERPYIVVLHGRDRPTLSVSANDGGTLTTIDPPGGVVSDFAFGGTLLIAVGHTAVAPVGAARAWRSDDLGVSWRSDPFAFPAGSNVVKVAYLPFDRVVALVETQPTGVPILTVWLSDDNGLTFNPSATTWPSRPTIGTRDPGRKELIVSGCGERPMLFRDRGDLHISDDKGNSWRAVTAIPSEEILTAAWGSPVPQNPPKGYPSLFVTTTQSGVLQSVDGGRSFVPSNRNLPGAPITNIDSTEHNGDRILIANGSYRWKLGDGYYDRYGLSIRRRGGESNLWINASLPSSGAPTFKTLPSQPGVVLAWDRTSSEHLTGFRSADAGQTWAAYGTRVPLLTERIVGDPGSPSRLLTFGTALLDGSGSADATPATRARSDDLGLTWSSFAPESFDTTALAPAPFPSSRIYAGRPGFHVSNDGGVSWHAAPSPAESVVPFDPINAIAIDPADERHVLATGGTYDGVVFESFDAGSSWSRLGWWIGSGPGLALTVEWHRTPRRVLVGTGGGILKLSGAVYVLDGTGSAGTTLWTKLGGPNAWRIAEILPNGPPVVSQILAQGPPTRKTYSVATEKGVFELTVDSESVTLPVYRFYNVATQTHFYTASAAERDHVIATWKQFKPEGIAFHAISGSRTDVGLPVWRLFNTQTGAHFYTASADERAHVLQTWPQFVDEGVAYRALSWTEPGTVKLFRFFNMSTGAHFYTADDDERTIVRQRFPGFVDEGVAYAVYPAAPE